MAEGYEKEVAGARTIWHAEVARLECELTRQHAELLGRQLVKAHRRALERRPTGTAFRFTPSSDDAESLTNALARARGHNTS